jgi:hypothetical protein
MASSSRLSYLFRQQTPVRYMDSKRIILNLGFWIIFSCAFDAASGVLFPDLPWDMLIWLWFFGLIAGTFIFNVGWYWLMIRR